MGERGMRVVIEGGDGVGKTTVMHLLAERNRKERGVETYTLEEPDSVRDAHGNALVPMAEQLRTIIKAKKYGRSTLTNVMLFNASRRENNLQIVEPGLSAGKDTYQARDFDSTTVYQGYGEGWNIDDIHRMVEEATSPDYMAPDYKYVLDLPEEERQRRVALRDNLSSLDTFESMGNEFHIRVAEGYRRLAHDKGLPLVSALPPAEEVADIMWRDMHGSN